MLLGFFLIICIIAVVIISIGATILRGVLSFIFALLGFPRQPRHSNHSGQQSQSNSQSQSQQSPPSGGKKREKMFDKTDGEYVDFEEIKE